MPIPEMRTSRWIEVRESPIHGKGVFAARRIPKGTRVIEYLGDRITHKEADDRYEDHDPNDNHTFLFIVDRRTVIDAGVNGNAARFINHSCDGNCTSVIEQRRVFIESTREIPKGEELGYDYEIGREKDDPDDVDEIFACRCGTAKCRGTMLYPAERPAKKPAKKKAENGKGGKPAKKKPAKKPGKKPGKRPSTRPTRRTKGGRGR